MQKYPQRWRLAVALFATATAAPCLPADELSAFPLAPPPAGSAYLRWLDKPVRHSAMVDEVETLAGWETRGAGRMELTAERAHAGKQALRFAAPMWNREYFERKTGPKPFGTTGGATQAVKVFPVPQDWSAFNRISVWVYVHDTGRRTYNVSFLFTCLGLPDRTTVPMAVYNANSLQPGAWNHVVWEIPQLKRDQVTDFTVHVETSGYDSDARGDLIVDVDQIELQEVEVDRWQGWAIEKDRIALSQIGYAPSAPKVALLNPTDATRFEAVDAETGRPALVRSVSTVSGPKTGGFALLDFSDLRKPGRYFLQVGTIRSDTFAIADDHWRPAVVKALNFFYCERCGVDIPGVHNACHLDLVAEDGGETKPIFGGWHDAADFTQITGNTTEVAYAMLELAGQLRRRGNDEALRRRVEQECRVGLDWLRSTLFASGRRMNYVEIRHYSDGVRNTADDKRGVVAAMPGLNFACAATQAKAAAYFQTTDPGYAANMREGALRDWAAALAHGRAPENATLFESSWAVLAGIELARLTGDPAGEAVALERAQQVLACQERTFLEGMPLTGFFYEKPDRRRIIQPDHMCHDEAPLLALAALCSAYPDHPDWMRWFSAAALYAEFFLRRGAEYMAPFRHFPNAVYRQSEIAAIADANTRADRLEQLQAGTRLGGDFYLRAFPIWTTPWARGSTGIQLSRTLALSAAATLTNDPAAQQLARWQIEWIFGRNPFAKSLMYGEGHYTPMHSHRQGELVGAIPVGMDCIGADEPFWPAGTNHTDKEIWVFPVARFLWSTAALGLPAHLEGRCDEPLVFIDPADASQHPVAPDAAGRFRCNLPAGDYTVRSGRDEWHLRLVSGRNYRIDLRAGRGWTAHLTTGAEPSAPDRRRLRLAMRGNGRHTIDLRLANARGSDVRREVTLDPDHHSTVEWEIELIDPAQPWVAAVIPDENADLLLSVIGP